MNNDAINQTGQSLSGKEEDRMPDELGVRTRRAKLTRRVTSKEETGTTENDTEEKTEDVYYDALLRFGIQI